MDNLETSTLLLKDDKWAVLQHLEWFNGTDSFFTTQASSIDIFHRNVHWMFRPESNMAAVIGGIRLVEEEIYTRIIFIPKPFPTNEGPKKFREFYESIKNYFQETVIDETVTINSNKWARVDRTINKIKEKLFSAHDEEDFQAIGLLCRESIISLAQAVHSPDIHKSLDGIEISDTDAKRKLESYIATELSGNSNEDFRKHAKACFQLTNSLQHKRNANYRDAALCIEATHSLINIITIISDQKETDK